MTAPRVAVRGLGIRRRRRWILRDLDWTHAAGEVAWLVGENGAGKSSLLEALAGRARPTSGEVVLDAAGAPARALYHHPAMRLPPEIRVADWDRLVDAVAGRERRHEALRPAYLDPRARAGSLSTGEAKRLLLEALLRRPAPFVFLDEPYAHLSDAGREALTGILARRARSSVVVVATNQPIPAAAGGIRTAIERA